MQTKYNFATIFNQLEQHKNNKVEQRCCPKQIMLQKLSGPELILRLKNVTLEGPQ